MAILKIRAGNDFTHVWAITRAGEPEDLTKIEAGATLTIRNFNTSEVIQFEIVDTNKIKSQHLLETTGVYNLKFEYNLADLTLPDRDRKCTVDVDAFQIVPKSALADDGSEFAVTTDMAIGFKGDSAYQVWLDAGNEGTIEDYLAYLQSPANSAIASIQEVEQAVEQAEGLRVTAEQGRATAEGLRVTAESNRSSAELLRAGAESDRAGAELLRAGAEDTREGNEEDREQAEALRVQAEIDRETNTETAIQNAETATGQANDAAALANSKATLANDAATNANTKAGLADTAATNANTKAGLADTAATTANNAATNISSTVINNEQVQAETYNVLNARIASLEELIRNMIFATATINKVDVVNEFNIHGTTNLILKGTVAPAITPDFIGQFYINTTAGVTYQSKGITNSGDWKQTSN